MQLQITKTKQFDNSQVNPNSVSKNNNQTNSKQQRIKQQAHRQSQHKSAIPRQTQRPQEDIYTNTRQTAKPTNRQNPNHKLNNQSSIQNTKKYLCTNTHKHPQANNKLQMQSQTNNPAHSIQKPASNQT